MICMSPVSTGLADYIDIVDVALATISSRLPDYVVRDDLASVGKLALISAMAQCSGSADEVRAYCFVRVRGAMLDELRRMDPMTRRQRGGIKAVTKAIAVLGGRFGRAPMPQEIADFAQLSVSDVVAIQMAIAAAEDASAFEWDSLPDTDAISPDEATEVADLRAGLQIALERLPANQALVLRRYYLEDVLLADIAGELGVSCERVRQIREAGEKKLRADFVVLALWQSFFNRSRA